MSRRIKIGIKDERASAGEFITAWRRADEGKHPELPKDRIYFEDLATLLSVLTPRRLEMLKTLRSTGPLSVRALAKELGRDYKNVHGDAKVMERLGLIHRDSEGLLHVPWSSIIAEMALAA
jgi:predicted transcriptional regulator